VLRHYQYSIISEVNRILQSSNPPMERSEKMKDTGKLVRNFEDVVRGDVASVGGKNASLGEMISTLASKGVPVPPGFATTASMYW
jgi:pyruvate phosphate dikinase-like enzyme